MIEINNVSKSFNNRQVLSDITGVFEPSKVNLIIGGSGEGKSVLAKCMVGLMEVDGGQVLFDGRDFIAMNREEKRFLEKKLACFFRGLRYLIQ